MKSELEKRMELMTAEMATMQSQIKRLMLEGAPDKMKDTNDSPFYYTGSVKVQVVEVWIGSKQWLLEYWTLTDEDTFDNLYIPYDGTTAPSYIETIPASSDSTWDTGYYISLLTTPGPAFHIPFNVGTC